MRKVVFKVETETSNSIFFYEAKMEKIEFKKLNINTCTAQVRIKKCKLNVYALFSLLPVKISHFSGEKMPVIEKYKGKILSIRFASRDGTIYRRGPQIKKALPNTVNLDICIGVKNIAVKIGKSSLHFTGIKKISQIKETIDLLFQSINRIQSVLVQIKENPDKLDELISWIEENYKGCKTIRKYLKETEKFKIEYDIKDFEIERCKDRNDDPFYKYFYDLASDQTYLKAYIEKIRKIANFQEIYTPSTHPPITTKPSIVMIKYTFILNDKGKTINCSKLYEKLIMRQGEFGMICEWNPFVKATEIKISYPIESEKPNKMFNQFVIHSTGSVVYTSKVSVRVAKDGFDQFRELMTSIGY